MACTPGAAWEKGQVENQVGVSRQRLFTPRLRFKSYDEQVWVAEIEDNVVGGLVLVPDDGFMLLANVAVHPDHKGAGLGGALLALAETQASEQGYRELRLSTHVDMPENLGLYTHLGWQRSGQQGNKISMRKPLLHEGARNDAL